ncbi:Palmitoyltransferase [Rhizopus stolonifer]|uniref:Palmitoyltransferase n=1 Tax=Rhizopus stolonifer TaxID=4846 RepID=A0A367IKC9_RHIST|nr:Palmitoyltransferase [Rhizopus stolonifer]
MIGLGLVMIALGILTGYHTYCITTNTTTIEAWEKGRSLTFKGMGQIKNVKKPYDQGLYRNLKVVLGRYPLLWFLPISMVGTGIDFPVNMRRSNEEDLTEKDYSSTARLNRPLSVETYWSNIHHDTTLLKELPSHHTMPESSTSTSTFSSNNTTLI